LSTHGDTRRAAFSAACELAAAGERPTVVAVRARLGGKGGQAAIQAGLNDWVAEAARRFQLPALPESLQGAVIAFWEVACQTQAQWDDARTGMLAQLEARDQQLATLTQAHNALERERDQALAERDRHAQVLEQAQAELFAAHQHTRALETERADLVQRLADAEARAEQLEQSGAQLAARVRDLEHGEQRLSEALERSECARDQWQAEARTAEQTVARLEQASVDGERERDRLVEALARSQAGLEEGRAALAEREARITTLTDLLERTQATHEAESARWLLQIDDQRQALSAARERERRWDQERTTLLNEIRRLSTPAQPEKPE
jgi:chromosome segregation ATPase